MKEYGYGYAVIGWVGDAEMFYRKTVDAEFIKGGNPENSVYSNMIFTFDLISIPIGSQPNC